MQNVQSKNEQQLLDLHLPLRSTSKTLLPINVNHSIRLPTLPEPQPKRYRSDDNYYLWLFVWLWLL